MASESRQFLPRSARQIAHATEIPQRGRLWPRGLPTRAGMGLTAMLLPLGFVAANPGLNLLLLLFGLAVGALLFNALLARRQVNLAQVRRILPDVAAVGRPSTVRYQISNRSRWMSLRSLWIVDGYSPCSTGLPVVTTWIACVPPQQTVTAEVTIVPTCRGLSGLDTIRLASKFPFGLFKRLGAVRASDALLVWPALWRPRIEWLERAARPARSSTVGGQQVHRGHDEFIGIREYRPGDNIRWIHWRRSASLDRVLVREMADDDPGRVTLALETAGVEDPHQLERLVSATASLACDALERGWHVGAILHGRTTVVLPPASGHAVRSRLLYELAVLEPAVEGSLTDVLHAWPAGAHWTGRAVLLHPQSRAHDPQTVAARLRAAIGRTTTLPVQAIAEWFDLSGDTPGWSGAVAREAQP